VSLYSYNPARLRPHFFGTPFFWRGNDCLIDERMFGHGCPYRRPKLRSLGTTRSGFCGLLLPLALVSFLAASDARPLDVRVRLAWGGGEARSWQGTIAISEGGELLELTPLGLEPDEPGSMQLLESGQVRITARTPRTYDGCDIRVRGPADAKLLVQLSAAPFSPPAPLELPLGKIAAEFVQFNLDDRNNRLLGQRSPGDALRVTFDRSSLVFEPGEKFDLVVEPRSLDLAAGSSYVLTATLSPGRTEESLWTSDSDIRVEAAGANSVRLAVPLPEREGVYDVRLALYPKRLITTNLVRGKPIAARTVQVVAIAPVEPPAPPPADWQSIYAFDPANPRWWEVMTRLPSFTRLPTIPRPVGNGSAIGAPHLGRAWVELGPRGWQAYPLSITTPGAPHVLEVEYPSDREQTLSISLVEPNAAGFVGPIGLDSGIDVPPAEAGHKPGIRRHRLHLWPQTKTPYILLVNRRDDRPAMFGKIDVLAGPVSLPALSIPPGTGPRRTLAAYYDKPLIAENFSAPEAVDPVSRRGLDDWVTFALAGQRLVETLEHHGYSTLVLTAACEGSAIYPSDLLTPTPKYDSGVFFDSGQDPVRKDVLELLFRLCDRNGIVLVPAVQFASPLPQLEALRQKGGAEAAGIEPIGPDGRPWLERSGNQGSGALYNALDPRVQAAMIAVVGELAERYGHHASFGGVGVQLSAEYYSLLPDETCSLDDVTFARFLRETRSEHLPTVFPGPAARWKHIREAAVKPWLDWRAEKVAELYGGMRSELVQKRSGAKLYLTTANLLAGKQLQAALRPELPPRNSTAEVLPWIGLDLSRLQDNSIVIPRPQRIVVAESPQVRDQEQHWNHYAPFDSLFLRQNQGVALHFAPPAPLRLADFDAVSPFGPDKTRTLLISQLQPADAAARERFVTSIARLDPPLLIDGGWLLPLGQEASLLPLIKVFRRLPAEPFELVARPNQPQEIVVRTLAKADRTYFYVVNPTAWPLTATLEFVDKSPVRLLAYADERKAELAAVEGGAKWTVQLEPFDLVGGEVAGSSAKVAGWSVTPPSEAITSLREQIGDINKRAHYLHDHERQAPLANSDFAQAAMDGGPAAWLYAREEGMTVEIDRQQGVAAPGSLHLVNRNPNAPLWVRSNPLPAPSTGRLQMTARVRTAGGVQPQLRLAIEGRLQGQVYYQRANYGAAERPGEATLGPLAANWTTCSVMRINLPTSGLTDVRVGFDLMSAGEVWIDDVQVSDLWLEDSEYKELILSTPTAKLQANTGRLNECRLFVEGYWPSFLRRNVQLADTEPEQHLSAKPESKADSAARPKPSLLAPSISLPKATPRQARAAERERERDADRGRSWWPSWPKWK
jgi:hypothetical protein